MRVEFDLSASTCVQQTVSGAFTGVDAGRAQYSYGAGNAVLTFKSRTLGADGNLYYIRVTDVGAGVVPTTIAKYSADILTLDVVLRRNAGGILATAAEVAAAVQAISQCPVLCEYGGTGASSPAALAVTALSGGVDPTLVSQGLWKFATTNGGLFYFNQRRPIVVSQFEATLGGSVAWTLGIVNLDNVRAGIAAERAVIAGATGTAVFAQNLVLVPRQGLQLIAAQTGFARTTVRFEAMR